MGRKTGLKEKKKKKKEKKKFNENNSWFGKVAEPAKKKTRGSGCGQPQAGSALSEVLKLNFNDLDYNMFQLNQRSQIIS